MPTPKEASTLWCPMARVANVGQVYNRVDTAYLSYQSGPDREHFERQEENCKCIADRCAAWRWVENREPSASIPNGFVGQPRPGRTLEPTHGYCGLAGKP